MPKSNKELTLQGQDFLAYRGNSSLSDTDIYKSDQNCHLREAIAYNFLHRQVNFWSFRKFSKSGNFFENLSGHLVFILVMHISLLISVLNLVTPGMFTNFVIYLKNITHFTKLYSTIWATLCIKHIPICLATFVRGVRQQKSVWQTLEKIEIIL